MFLVAEVEKLHHDRVGAFFNESKGGAMERHHLLQACGYCRQELAYVHVGKQCLAELKHNCLFSALAICEVASDLGKPEHFAAGVTNGGEDAVRPEARAVFAYPPAFVFNSSSLCCPLQQLSGAAAVNVCLGEEAREVFTNNLVGCVLFVALRAGIPGSDVALHVEKVDGVVAHAVEQRSQLQIFVTDKFQGFMLLRDVADNAEYGCACRCLDRLQHDVDRKLSTILAQAEEIHGGAHLASTGMGMVVLAMRRMAPSEALRNEVFDRLADQFRLAVTK